MSELPGRVSGFSPLPSPGTPAASPQRRLPCRDELLTGPKTACLILCQARHGAAGMLAASWPTPHITGFSPFYPSFSYSLSLHPFFLVPQDCYAKLTKQRLWECCQAQMYPNHICTISHHGERHGFRQWAIFFKTEQGGAGLLPHLVPHLWNRNFLTGIKL